MGRGHRCPGFSSNPSYSRCCYLVQRCGWLPLHGTGPGGFPGPGGAATDGVAPVEAGRQEVVVHLVKGGKGRGGV